MSWYFRHKKRTLWEKIPFYTHRYFFILKMFLKANITYYYKIFFIKKKIAAQKIAILLPSKERAKKFLRLIKSVEKCTFDKSRLYIMVLLDKNEKQKRNYEKIKKKFLKKKIKLKFFYCDLKSHCARNNFLANKIKCDLYFLMNDDAFFTYNNWDNYVDLISSKINMKIPNAIFMRTIGHKVPHYIHSDFPIVNKSWLNALGYIGNKYTYGMIDSWISELAILSNRFIITKPKILNHLNSNLINEKPDNTTNQLLISQKNDWSIWEKTKIIRIKDSRKLKKYFLNQ